MLRKIDTKQVEIRLIAGIFRVSGAFLNEYSRKPLLATLRMNRYYYSEIENLRSRLILMGERSTEAFKTAMRGLLNESILDCERAVEMDKEIDFLEREIETEAIKYISLRSPVAGDLRMVMVAIKAAANLERIGDGGRSVGRRSKRILSQGKLNVDLLNIEEMAVITLEMLEATKDMILQPDSEVIARICRMDEEVDSRNDDNLKGFVRQAEVQPESAGVLFELALISKVIERVADHVTNISRLLEELNRHSPEYSHVAKVVY